MTMKEAPQKAETSRSEGWMDVVDLHESEDRTRRKTFRIALVAAILLHVGLLAFHFPQLLEAEPPPEEEEPIVYKIQQVQIQPPEPEPEPPPPEPEEPEPEPEPEAVEIPMPDPEPEEPEPIVEPEPEPVQVPEPTPEREVDIVETTERTELPEPVIDLPQADPEFTIPEGPPPAPEPEGPIHVGGDVNAPVKTRGQDPGYTPAARTARIEGTVVVQAVINKQGRVTDIKILKDQPMGLGERAVAAIRDWRFRPATLNGKPVDVYYNLTVNFQLN